jgi:hypothetical protein
MVGFTSAPRSTDAQSLRATRACARDCRAAARLLVAAPGAGATMGDGGAAAAGGGAGDGVGTGLDSVLRLDADAPDAAASEAAEDVEAVEAEVEEVEDELDEDEDEGVDWGLDAPASRVLALLQALPAGCLAATAGADADAGAALEDLEVVDVGGVASGAERDAVPFDAALEWDAWEDDDETDEGPDELPADGAMRPAAAE